MWLNWERTRLFYSTQNQNHLMQVPAPARRSVTTLYCKWFYQHGPYPRPSPPPGLMHELDVSARPSRWYAAPGLGLVVHLFHGLENGEGGTFSQDNSLSCWLYWNITPTPPSPPLWVHMYFLHHYMQKNLFKHVMLKTCTLTYYVLAQGYSSQLFSSGNFIVKQITCWVDRIQPS